MSSLADRVKKFAEWFERCGAQDDANELFGIANEVDELEFCLADLDR